jgi:hypothetical protein
MRDRLLAKLRAHVALAVNDDLRQLKIHVTGERIALAEELRKSIDAELTPLRQQLDDLALCNQGLLREVVRLERELQRLSESFDTRSLPGSLDESRLPFVLTGAGETQRKAA